MAIEDVTTVTEEHKNKNQNTNYDGLEVKLVYDAPNTILICKLHIFATAEEVCVI